MTSSPDRQSWPATGRRRIGLGRCQGAIDQGVAGSEVTGRVAQPLPVDCRRRAGHQGIDQMAALAHDRPHRALDQLLGLRARHVDGEREGRGFGQDQSVGRAQIVPHPARRHRQSLQQGRRLRQPRARGHHHGRKGRPFHLPADAAALVFLDLRLVQPAKQGGVQSGGGDQGLAGHRVGLLGHGAGPSATAAGALVDLADLGLGQQHRVLAELAQRPGHQRQPRSQLDDAVALGVPGQRRAGEIELRGQTFHHRDAVAAERRQGSGGAAELHHQRGAAAVRRGARDTGPAAAATRRTSGRRSSAAPAGSGFGPPSPCRGAPRPARPAHRPPGRGGRRLG